MKTRHTLITLALATFVAAPAHAEYCREFTKDVYVGGRLQQAYGTSCLQPDGAWLITQQPTVQQQPITYVQPVTYVQQPVQYYPTSYYERPYYRPSVFNVNFSSRNYGYRNHHRGHGYHYSRGYNHGHGRGRW